MNATTSFSPVSSTEIRSAVRPSLAATLCGILAMTLLILSSGPRGWALPFCALALLATHFTNWRWPREAMAPVALRLVLFVAIFLTAGVSYINIDWVFRDSTVQFFGQLAAVELVLQHWRTRPGERYPAISLLLSCTIFLAACNERYGIVPDIVPAVTPVFWICLLWALRDWKPQRNSPASTCRPFSPSRVHFLTAIFLILTLTGGALLHRLGVTYREELMHIGSNIVRQKDTVSLAGISERPRLSSSFDARESTERVLKIEGSLSAPHLRAAAFDTYNFGTWSPPLSRRDLTTWNARQLGGAQSGPRVRVTRLVDLGTNALFAPLNSSGLIPDPSHGPDPVEVRGNRESGLLICDENAPWGYQIIDNEQNIAGVPTYQGPFAAPLTAQNRGAYLQLPDDLDARVRQIAQVAAGDALTAPDKVENIADYLMTHHKYALSVSLDSKDDPLTQFLVEKKDAHCEFFAAAMTIMARLNGIPARYVVGYLAHESELGSGGAVTVVRQRDAHAWSEIWLDGVGWVTADATPGGGRPDALPNVSAGQRASEWARDALENIRQRAVKIPKRTWFFIVAIPLALWVLIRVRPFHRNRAQSPSSAHDYASPAAQIAQLAPRFERWLTRQGATLAPSLSWQRAFARHETLPAQRPDAALWLRDYERARFGADWEIAEDLETRLGKIEAQ